MILKTESLPEEVRNIVCDKSTEAPFTGEYNALDARGTFLCRQCGLGLFRASSKFDAGCGWPSFDEEIAGAVRKTPDRDLKRTEILCARCDAHLGHVFYQEGLTVKNTRHCVNSLSLDFVNSLAVLDTEEALFAAGCFWGVQYYLKQLSGVVKTEVGFTGGNVSHPTYEAVCGGTTGHFEAIRVLYDPAKTRYTEIARYFFEIHDPTQSDGQGPDHGAQYRSAIFYYNDYQKKEALALIQKLKEKGYAVVTQILPVSVFWRAAGLHQDYYAKTQKEPYCHRYVERFGT